MSERSALGAYKHCQLANVQAVTKTYLAQKGVKLLALDFDGVLGAHGEVEPSKEVALWLDAFVTEWGASNLVIYSNKPFAARITRFAQRWPGVDFYIGPKKPYPEGLIALAEERGLRPQDVLLVDDRLLTGVLAAHLAGAQVVWTTDVITRFDKRPVYESFFASLRWLERKWLG